MEPGRGCGSVYLRSVCRLMLCRKDTEPVPAIKTYTKSKKLRSTRTTMSLRSSNRNDQAMTTPASTSTPTTTTRVCIKNLPLSFDEGKLKAHLQSSIASLILTDCKLLKTKDGRSRKIAFVGFKSPEVSIYMKCGVFVRTTCTKFARLALLFFANIFWYFNNNTDGPANRVVFS